MTTTMSPSARQHRRHTAENHKVVGTPTLRHELRLCQGGPPKQALTEYEQIVLLPTPPAKVYSTVNPMWGSKGNGSDLLLPDPPSLGVKQNRGQPDRMFLDNFTYERGSSLCLPPPLHPMGGQVCTEDVGGLPP